MDRYELEDKKTKPIFKYIVKLARSEDYYLYVDFEKAYRKARAMGAGINYSVIIEVYRNNRTKEYVGKSTYKFFLGKAEHYPNAQEELHIYYYITAGYWLNPNEEWVKHLSNDTHTV